MNRTLVSVLAVTMMLSLVAISGSATASQDEWPDNCDDAPIIDSGQYSGSIDSPRDQDRFRVQLDKGEYYAVSIIVPDEHDLFSFLRHPFDHEGVSFSDGISDEITPGEEWTFRIFAEEDGVHCFKILDQGGETAGIPYEWQMSIAKNDPEPAGFDITELQEENDELGTEINDLESQLEEKNERIEELESQLEETGDVTIDVSVEPSDQATFQVGGEMAVSVDADGASPSDVTLSFASEQYTVSGGEATIPLESAGPQQLAIEYEDASETVTIDVADSGTDASDGDETDGTTDGDDSSSTDDSNTADDTSSSDSQDTSGDTSGGSDDGFGSGFGLVVALAGIVSLGLLSLRRRQ